MVALALLSSAANANPQTILDMVSISVVSGGLYVADSNGNSFAQYAFTGVNNRITNDKTTLSVVVNTLYDITLSTSAAVGAGGDATAFVDPTIVFSPGQTLESGLTLLFSDAPPAESVPEPSSFALIGLGVTGLLAARRRRTGAPTTV